MERRGTEEAPRRAIAVRQMPSSEIERIAEIDRSEHITGQYLYHRGGLELRAVDVRAPAWSRTGTHAHSVRAQIAAWQPILDRGGTLLGAFEARALVGFAVYRPDLEVDMANLAALHVSRSHRREGVGSMLTREVIRFARAAGARWLYVSATPSFPTVQFYMKHGFKLTADPHPDLLELEPDDIHMILEL